MRYVVRAKVAQLLAAGGVACGLAGLGAGDLTPLDAAVLAGIAMGSVGGSLSLWWAARWGIGAGWRGACSAPRPAALWR